MKKILIIVIIVLLAFIGGYYLFSLEEDKVGDLKLYGNINDMEPSYSSLENGSKIKNVKTFKKWRSHVNQKNTLKYD